jgi:hypothetical protein
MASENRDGFYVGFRNGALEAGFYEASFENPRFRTCMPITPERNRESVIFELAEKLVESSLYDRHMEIKSFGLDYESFSYQDVHMFNNSANMIQDSLEVE